MSTSDQRLCLLERITEYPVIYAESYMLDLALRGYPHTGAYIPEVVLEHRE